MMSRTCGGEVLFDDVEKEALRRVIWRMAEFSGIKVVTYCLMKNHFHLLAEVPHREMWLQRFEGPDGEAKLMEHLQILYSRTYIGLLRDELSDLRARGMAVLAERRIEGLKKRFCDLSLFVKEVKERFSRWFNKRRGRKGTLWMDRFKSVLVEGKGEALRTMAAYIDLNPVRAGFVKDPKDYRWCGYAEALGGSRRAQRGLCKAQGKPVDGWKSAGAAEAYRCLLHAEGREIKDAQNEKVLRRGVSAESARAVLAEKGQLSTAELVRLRVRYFTDGVVLGSREFVDGIFEAQRGRFSPKRKEGGRRIAESAEPFYTLRRLRVQPLG
ncbi:MAG: chemotaxis protein CheW [Verrucomicrobia bacterium]|nr:chemotaxis protein CheW [Verrucomicrobiota bacterium]